MMQIDAGNVRKSMLAMLDSSSSAYGLKLRFGECVIAVRTNAEELREKLKRYYADFLVVTDFRADLEITALESEPPRFHGEWMVKQPESGKEKIKEEYLEDQQGRIVRKLLTGMLFSFGNHHHLAIGPCSANDNQVINFINSRYIQWMLDRGCLLCHAAGVAMAGQGLALAGFSGMGKSTLALHMMHRGVDFVSNDRLLIQKNGSELRMHGVAKLPRVNPGTILGNPSLAGLLESSQKETYARMAAHELWNLEHKHDVYLDECFGHGKFLSSTRMAGLVILNWRHKYPRTSLELVDIAERPDLLETVVKSPGLFFLPDADKPYDFQNAAYLKMLNGCAVFEARGGVDFDHVAEACIHFLHQQQSH